MGLPLVMPFTSKKREFWLGPFSMITARYMQLKYEPQSAVSGHLGYLKRHNFLYIRFASIMVSPCLDGPAVQLSWKKKRYPVSQNIGRWQLPPSQNFDLSYMVILVGGCMCFQWHKLTHLNRLREGIPKTVCFLYVKKKNQFGDNITYGASFNTG